MRKLLFLILFLPTFSFPQCYDYAKDPFIEDLNKEYKKLFPKIEAIDPTEESLTDLSGGWQANMIYGITEFLLNRAKKEIKISLIKQMKKQIEKDPTFLKPLVTTCFSNSYTFISNFDQINIKSILPELKRASEEDFKHLPSNSMRFLYTRYGDTIPSGIRSGMQLFANTYNRSITNDCDLLSNILMAIDSVSDPKIKADLQLARGIIALSRINKDQREKLKEVFEHYLKKPGDFGKSSFYKNHIAGSHLADLKGKEEVELLQKLLEESLEFKDKLQKKVEKFNTLEGNLNEGEIADIDEYNRALRQIRTQKYSEISSLVLHHVQGALILMAQTEKEDKVIRKVFDYVREGNQMVIGVFEEDFSKVAVKALNLTERILKEEMEKTAPEHSKSLAQAISFVSFIGNLATAKDYEDVEKVLESFLDPAGGATAKRAQPNKFYLTLNSYFGMRGGMEMILPKSDTLSFSQGGYFAPTLPLGIELGWSGPKSKMSYGIFVQVLDLGNLASFRLSGNDYDTLTINQESYQNISFAQVFSPGVYFTWGFAKNFPLSLNAGINFAPSMRKIEGTNLTIDEKYGVLQVSLGLAIDMSLFNFTKRVF